MKSLLILTFCLLAHALQAADTPRVLVVVGPSKHPPGSHEVAAGGRLIQHCVENMTNLPGVKADVVEGWPDKALRDAAGTVVFIGDFFPPNRLPNAAQNLADLDVMMRRGCGIVCVHYATGVHGDDVTPEGDHPLLRWLGGYFANRTCRHHESFAKIFPAATITPAAPNHPTMRGWKEFTLNDEPYTNNYFGRGNIMAPNVTTLATSLLPPENPKRETVAWCIERPDGGRGFGIVMPHFYKNWRVEDLRRFILNGIVWTAKLEVPADGVQTAAPDLAAFKPESVEYIPPPPKEKRPAASLPADFKSKLQTTLTRHLDQLLDEDGSVGEMKGKTAEGSGAFAFYLMYERTNEQKYRKAALSLVDQVLREMRATKFGVLPIKEKEKGGGKTIIGGGPPALGNYASGLAYILHKEGGRSDDLKYIATVLDRFPWSESGWWASTIDVATGEPKEPITKPGIINKTAAIAMAAGMVSLYVRDIDPALSASLKHKTDKCIYGQILPAQLEDGFWHYSLLDKDPKDKDVLGYFMLTMEELMKLQRFNPAYREEKLTAALRKAQAFALQHIAPMTDPNTGTATTERATRGTPKHYVIGDEAKRSFQLGLVLIGGGHTEEGIKIMSTALDHFPIGNGGQDGAHAAEPSALILSWHESKP